MNGKLKFKIAFRDGIFHSGSQTYDEEGWLESENAYQKGGLNKLKPMIQKGTGSKPEPQTGSEPTVKAFYGVPFVISPFAFTKQFKRQDEIQDRVLANGLGLL